MKSARLRIEGMHCGGCAAVIQSLLARQDGVKAVDVTFTERLARIQFDPHATSQETLVAVIEKAGYQVTPLAATNA